MGYTPPNFLLAQETHFFAGLAFTLAAPAMHLPWWWGAALILVVDLAKELTFDKYVEKQPFFWDGLTDYAFYVLGVVTGLALYLVPAYLA